jgi:hypothetical protein
VTFLWYYEHKGRLLQINHRITVSLILHTFFDICRISSFLRILGEALNDQTISKVFFFDTLKELTFSKPYAVLTTTEVSSLVNRFEAAGKLICTNPRIRSQFKRLNANLDPGIAWCVAIDIAMKDGLYPCVVLPRKKYEAAMSILQLVDEMGDERSGKLSFWGHGSPVL